MPPLFLLECHVGVAVVGERGGRQKRTNSSYKAVGTVLCRENRLTVRRDSKTGAGDRTCLPLAGMELPATNNAELELEIAADTELAEPMWCYMKSGRAPSDWSPEKLQPLDHPAGLREISSVRIGCPYAKEGSVTSTMARKGVIALQNGAEHPLELHFDGGCRATTLDFRPALPLIFCV
jgi:hypothetical protein